MRALARAVVLGVALLASVACGEPISEPPARLARVKVRLFYGATERDAIAMSLPWLSQVTYLRDMGLHQASVVESRLTPETRVPLRLDDGEELEVTFCRLLDGFHFEISSSTRAEPPLIGGMGDARALWFVGTATRLSPGRHRAHIVVQASERITLGCSPPDLPQP